ALRRLRHPRRYCDQSPGDRSAASHRRQRQFHRSAFPATFSAIGAEGGIDRWRQRHCAVRARRAREWLLRRHGGGGAACGVGLGGGGGEEFAALCGVSSMGVLGYWAVLAQIGLIALVTAATSRHTVNRTIETIH